MKIRTAILALGAASPTTTQAATAAEIQGSIETLTGYVLEYALALAAIGILSMALVEAWKKVCKSRERFLMRALGAWIVDEGDPGGAREELCDGDLDSYRTSACASLLSLASGQASGTVNLDDLKAGRFETRPALALFSLDLDKMMGQLDAATEIVLNNPELHREAYVFLTQGAAVDDITNWFRMAQEPQSNASDDPQRDKLVADTFTRIRQWVRRRLDGFQLVTRFRWARRNQFAALVTGAVLLFIVLLMALPVRGVEILWYIPAAALGGVVAPVAKDLVVAIRRARGGG